MRVRVCISPSPSLTLSERGDDRDASNSLASVPAPSQSTALVERSDAVECGPSPEPLYLVLRERVVQWDGRLHTAAVTAAHH